MSEKGELRELLHEAEELEEEVVPPKSALPPLPIPDIALGRLLLFLILFFAALVFARAMYSEGPSIISLLKSFARKGAAPPSNTAVLLDYFLIMCVSCQFLPIPTLPPIAFAAKAFHPLLVAFLGGIGTCIANLNDYAILSWLFRHQKVKKVRDFGSYRRLLAFFDRYAFITMTVASFLPVPIDVVRMLAISRAYPYWRYVLSTFVGRFPRYVIIAYLGRELPVKYILVLFAVTAIPALAKFVSDIIKKRKRR